MAEYDPNSLSAQLARIESRQIAIADRLDEIAERMNNHSLRLKYLEEFRWKLIGAIGLGSAGGAAAFSKLLVESNMKDKLKSRKLWVAIGGVLTVLATEWAGVSPEMSEQIIGAVIVIVPAYIGGQGIVDAVKEYATKK